MNKNIGILIAVIVIAGGAYLFMQNKSGDEQNKTKGDSSSASTQSTEDNSSLKNLSKFSICALGFSRICVGRS